ncbi:hypothetical protein EUX98_g8696 [Antrodiella citrinella]|uniref:Probable RNA polymerase II nuclear localization protein SLC7A6OS n=1 Tax=Antrodiella citrinella TaxID=2447956 RepID=A0A4S4M4D9_9APHY|nr:hypothetical protein EUX98_g8696 [Antrodiella citrinella]
MEDIQPTDSQQSLTLIRIKRKRTEEPLDALVIDSKARRKRSKGALNVFQFVETVEEGAWDDEQRKKDIEDRISSLAREKQKVSTSPMLSSQPPESAASVAPSASASSVPSPVRQPPVDPTRAYTVVPSASQESTRSARQTSQPSAPPKVAAYKDLVAEGQRQPSFTMYDAIPSSSTLSSAPSSEADREMAKFMPMLNEYLKLNEDNATTPLPSSHSLAKIAEGDDEYVWDVFYQRPTTFQELYEPAVGGIHIGTLSGLPPEADDWDSDGSDFEDEDDEDSNAEDWYMNDYPDEEESDSAGDEDEFHEDSEEEQVYRDDGDLDWR